jgi:hypothetical protein
MEQRSWFIYSVTTDAQGRFKIDHLVDGLCEIGVEFPTVRTDASQRRDIHHRTTFALKPGENKTGLRLGGSGRPVVAHIVIREQKEKKIFPIDGVLTLTAAAADNQHVTHLGAVARDDGRVQFDDVLAGEYTLDVTVMQFTPQTGVAVRKEARAIMKLTVPPIPAGLSDEPLDVGPVELKTLE